MQFQVTGGGWVTAAGFGRLSQAPAIPFAPGAPVRPAAREIFTQRPARWGRFDDTTRCGLTAMALALRDANLEAGEEKRTIGIVSASTLECLETDIGFYRTALEAGGSLASPNLFSYTLPGIMLGEAAILFRLGGPTLCVGETESGCGEDRGRGMTALATALRLLADGAAQTMLAGWTECFTVDGAALEWPLELSAPWQGAAFVVLEADSAADKEGARTLFYESGLAGAEIRTLAGRKIESLFELFEMDLS